jgi:hypothetical protein
MKTVASIFSKQLSFSSEKNLFSSCAEVILVIVVRFELSVTVWHLTPGLPKVQTFDSHFLKDARKLFQWDGGIFCSYEIYQKVHMYWL